MAINYNPFSQFNVDPSSFSLPAGMDMNQAATMNAIMQPVPIFGQQNFSAFEPDTQSNDSISRQTRQTRRSNQQFDDEPASRVLDFAQTTLDLIQGGIENAATSPAVLGLGSGSYMGPPTQESLSPFLQSPDTPSGLGGPLLRGFNMINEAAEVPVELGPLRPVNPRTVEFLSPDVIAAGEEFGITFPSQVALPDQQAPARIAPMGRDATRAMLQERFGAPTISAIQNLPSGQGMGMMTDEQGRMISLGDDRTAFDQASQDRIDRLEARPDFMTAYSSQELRDIAEAGRTKSEDTGVATRGEMTFEEARKFVPKGERETTKSYNQRIKAFQAQQNSYISKLKEQYEQFRVQGQVLNNQRIQAYIAQYQQTEPEKYRETLQVAQEMLRDEILEDEVQVAMYVIDQMGGKSTDIFDPVVEFMRGGDGSGQTYTPEQEAKIERFMEANKFGREDALRELRNAGRIQ